MLYCPNNISLSHVWINHGINRCFFYTVPISIYGGLLIILGLFQFLHYRKTSRRLEGPLAKKPLFLTQITLNIFMIILTLVMLCLQASLIGNGLYGFMVVNFLFNVFCWPLSIILIFLERRNKLPNSKYRGHGPILLIFWSLAFAIENLTLISIDSNDWWFYLSSLSDKLEFSLFILRYIFTACIFFLGLHAPGISQDVEYNPMDSDHEASPNLPAWKKALKNLKFLLPYLWPKKSIALQSIVVFSFFLVLAGRICGVFVPIYYKLIVNALGGSGGAPTFCWDIILVYVALKFLQGGGGFGMGLLNNTRTFLWISVQQYTSREVQVQLFSHLHSLSLRWHLGRKTGEVLRILDRGTISVNTLLSYILFNILPTICDILIAVIYFTTAFNYLFGIIVFVTMIAYLVSTFVVTEWRTQYRRSMNLADNEQRSKSVDSLLNYETVKYYGGESFETERYLDAILDYQREEWKANASLSFLNTVQNIIINGGLLVGSVLCAWMVYKEELTVGDYVLYATYIMQLHSPLNFFGTYYRMIQQSFIDMENMFDLLEEEQEIKDEKDAEELVLPQGLLEFRDVSFGYSPEKPILKNISFQVLPGKTLAVVGPTGAGKSTIMRLIFRFFEVDDGSILIDKKNINMYTQKSLRGSLGVVPQDTVLFNDTVHYNIHYGRISSPISDVVTAAKSAEIHESILNFPDKYETRVGERGLRLSGGEKQRIAIARTILKAPTFILLDEATSALDTQTERHIQSALMRICAGRTTLIIAHRLSTIVHSDTIIVLKDGVIAETGSHETLLAANGIYCDMWRQQLEANNNATVNGDPPTEQTTQ